MQQGDLSNKMGQIVGMRFENCLYNFGKLNKPAKGFLEQLVYAGDINIYLLTILSERKAMAFCYKYGVPYTRVIGDLSPLEIPEICQENHFVSYWDTDDRILEAVRARGHPQVKAQKWTQSLDGLE